MADLLGDDVLAALPTLSLPAPLVPLYPVALRPSAFDGSAEPSARVHV